MTAAQLETIPIKRDDGSYVLHRAIDRDGVLWFVWTDDNGSRWRFRA